MYRHLFLGQDPLVLWLVCLCVFFFVFLGVFGCEQEVFRFCNRRFECYRFRLLQIHHTAPQMW